MSPPAAFSSGAAAADFFRSLIMPAAPIDETSAFGADSLRRTSCS
jgi:hypothetical protein